MASSINNATIYVTGSPDIHYGVTYTSSRTDNSTVTYNFTIKTYLTLKKNGQTMGDSTTNFLSGYVLTAYLTVNGVQQSVELKGYSEKWNGANDTTPKSTKTVSIKCPSTTGNANQTVTFQVVNRSSATDGTAGEITTTDYYVTSPALLYTNCTAPTSFTVSPSPFESSVTLTWSGANGGTNNSIASYYIQYCVSSNNSTWGNWTTLATVTSTAKSDTYTKDISSLVARGNYVKFQIRTQGSAGSSYYSGYKASSSVRRNPYTACTAPTSFTITPDSTSADGFNTTLTLTWSGAGGGTSNAINGYFIQYNVSSNGSTWNGWQTLNTINTNATYGSYTADMSSLVTRGYYVDFRIRTQGSAGSSYYSSYKDVAHVRRNLYTKCGAPTTISITSNADLQGATHTDIFESSVSMQWSGATNGSNNAIQRYQVEYRTSSNKTNWTDWTLYTESATTPYVMNIIADRVTRGEYVQFRVKAVGTRAGYDSNYKESGIMRKNSMPSNISSISVTPTTLEYSKGDNISISWSKPTDANNNIYKYRVRLYPNIKDTSTYYDYETTNTSFVLQSTDAHYVAIVNNQQLKFAVKPIDIFGIESSDYTQSGVITRYDTTGIAIGINGKWVNCQVFYGQTVFHHILTNGEYFCPDYWHNGTIDTLGGSEVSSTNAVRSDFIEGDGVCIQGVYEGDMDACNVSCTFYYYDENHNYIECSDTVKLSYATISADSKWKEICDEYAANEMGLQPYKYIRIVLQSPTFVRSELYTTIRVTQKAIEWIEQDAFVGVNGSWSDCGVEE